MIQITRLPEEVKRFLLPLKPWFSYRHFLVFCWLMVALLICFDKATFTALGRHTPKHIGWWHLRRLVACSRWPWERVLTLLPQLEPGNPHFCAMAIFNARICKKAALAF